MLPQLLIDVMPSNKQQQHRGDQQRDPSIEQQNLWSNDRLRDP